MNVVTVYSDAAISGATMHRDGLQKLLSDAARRGGSPFRAVLVDDLSRLTRDLWDMGQIVFRDLLSLDVRVIDVMTGIASDAPVARQLYAAVGMGNDLFLQMVKHETHRGLEGRHAAGFWTGGRVYGFRTVTEPNPPDPEHPRMHPVIDEAQAPIVRRIFTEYAAGRGFATIARGLNEDRIPAPYDTILRKKKRGPGWGFTTIRAILSNERYIGVFVWNKRKYVRVGGKRHRRAIKRPESEWKRLDLPELAVVDRPLWDTVQATLGAQRERGPGRPLGSDRTVHLLSGTVKCGICGAGMGIVGGTSKGEKRYVTFGCSSHRNRGSTTCANARTISEKKLNAAVLGALAQALSKPRLLQRIVARAQKHLRESEEAAHAPRPLAADIAAAEDSIRRLVDALARSSWSDALGARLREEEARLAALKQEQATGAASGPPAPPTLDPERIVGFVRDLPATLALDPQRARDLLRAHLPDGIRLVPESKGPTRWYVASGALSLIPSTYIAGRSGNSVGCSSRFAAA